MRYLLVLAAALTFTASATAAPLTFVLAGQSNMAGFGPLPSTPLAAPNVTALTAQGWQPAAEPLLNGAGSGPALSFANQIVAATGQPVRLVPCAETGSYLDQWLPAGDLYQRCLQRIGGEHVDGLLFFQGESDAQQGLLAGSWADRFQTFLESIREATGVRTVVFAQIGRYDNPLFPAWATVKAQQASVTGWSSQMVSTDDLAELDGQPHYTLDSYRIIGERFAQAWLASRAAVFGHRREF